MGMEISTSNVLSLDRSDLWWRTNNITWEDYPRSTLKCQNYYVPVYNCYYTNYGPSKVAVTPNQAVQDFPQVCGDGVSDVMLVGQKKFYIRSFLWSHWMQLHLFHRSQIRKYVGTVPWAGACFRKNGIKFPMNWSNEHQCRSYTERGVSACI